MIFLIQSTFYIQAIWPKLSEVYLSVWIPFEDSLGGDILQVFIGNGTLPSFLLALISVWGLGFLIWGIIGFLRFISEIIPDSFGGVKKRLNTGNIIRTYEVAAIVPSHNEELVITDTLESLSGIVEKNNIFIISDGSVDKTGEIARNYGVNVLELNPGRGKAGALETGIAHFNLVEKYKALILVDADTRLKRDYLKYSLPFFNEPDVVAVAGYAKTIWNPQNMSWRQILFVSHRDRVYFLFQLLIKFGQTWKYTNVTHIVPGFASIYRTSVLNKININPKGLVIEDFNMTFELHHKKLGRIAHHPRVIAYTQDPDNMRDYFRQIKRWHLGFWQTVKLHGFWPSKFCFAMGITLAEVILGSFVFLLMPFLMLISFIPSNFFFLDHYPLILQTRHLMLAFFVGVWLSDYMLTIIASVTQRRKEYLLVGLLFPLIRFIDAIAFLIAIPQTFLIQSNGQWISPSRRKS